MAVVSFDPAPLRGKCRTSTDAGRSGSHRRPGPTETESFGEVLMSSPRQPFVVVGGGLLGVVGGGWLLLTGPAQGGRILGLLAVFAGLLVLASYLVHFIGTRWLGNSWWSATKPRRVVATALAYAWEVYFWLLPAAALVRLVLRLG